jgi:hypothetical protein
VPREGRGAGAARGIERTFTVGGKFDRKKFSTLYFLGVEIYMMRLFTTRRLVCPERRRGKLLSLCNYFFSDLYSKKSKLGGIMDLFFVFLPFAIYSGGTRLVCAGDVQ